MNGATRAQSCFGCCKCQEEGQEAEKTELPPPPAREHLDHSTLLLPTVDGASSQSKEMLQGSGKNVDPVAGLPRSESPLGVMLSQ